VRYEGLLYLLPRLIPNLTSLKGWVRAKKGQVIFTMLLWGVEPRASFKQHFVDIGLRCAPCATKACYIYFVPEFNPHFLAG
jgi:hypothetical protein